VAIGGQNEKQHGHFTPKPPTPTVIKERIDPFDFYARELPGVELKATSDGWTTNVCCPFHEEKDPSFGVNVQTGAFRCFGCNANGGSVLDFTIARHGLSLDEARAELASRYGIGGEAMPARPHHRPAAPLAPTPKPIVEPAAPIPPEALASRPQRFRDLGAPSASWDYTDEAGRPVAFVNRFDLPDGGKEFRPQTWTPADGWQWKAPPEPRPLYGLDRLAVRPDAPVLICEGEKATDASALLLPDCVSVATMNGAQSPGKTDLAPLAGRQVGIWPDHDRPGADYAVKVADLALAAGAVSVEILDLASLATEPRTREPRELPKGWDAADALDDGWTPETLAKAARWVPVRTEERGGDAASVGDSGNCGDNGDKDSPPWPDLVPLGAPDLPRLRADILPGWAGTYAAALATATETPPEMAAGLILAAAAVPCARRLRVMVAPGHFEPTNIWLAVGLPPGNRKSAVQAAACAPLVDWERETAASKAGEIARAESEAKTLQARANAARAAAARAKDPLEIEAATKESADLEAKIQDIPAPPQLWTSDATPEKLGVLLAAQGECMAWLSSEAGIFDILAGRYSKGIPNLDLVLKAWSGDSERVDRGSRPPVFLRSPRLTVGLSPQPDVLRGLSTQPGFRGRGLLARFHYLLPPSPLGYRDLGSDRPGANVPESAETAYSEGIRAMLGWPTATDPEGRERPHLVRLNPAAYAEWLEFARAVEKGMRPGGDYEHATDLAGKSAGGAARIAGVLHGIEHAHGHPWEVAISHGTMSRALELAAVTLKHGLAVMDLMGADPSIAAARKVWDWLERGRRDQVTVRNAYQALKGTFPRVSGLEDALDALEERGYIRIVKAIPTTPGRPPSPTILVRPEIAEGWR
jgi:hypothetical protein